MALTRLKNRGITDDTITEAKWGGGQFGRKNIIINGAMQIAQRGTSFTGIANGKFPIDRFALYSTGGGSFNTAQSTDSPSGLSNSLKITVATADSSIASGDYYIFNQKLEGLNTAHLKFGTSSAQNVTLSFYVKSSLTGTFSGSMTNGNYDRAYPFTYTISSANTWERKTISIDGDTSGTWGTGNTMAMSIWWDLGTGTTYTETTSDSWRTTSGGKYGVSGQTQLIGTSSATWQITGVQLEIGSVATPFEHRSHGEELALCQRYYQTIFNDTNTRMGQTIGSFYNTTRAFVTAHLPVQLREIPTVATGGDGSINGRCYNNNGSVTTTSVNVYYASLLSVCCDFVVSGATQGSAFHFDVYDNNAWIYADAEL